MNLATPTYLMYAASAEVAVECVTDHPLCVPCIFGGFQIMVHGKKLGRRMSTQHEAWLETARLLGWVGEEV